ncbi:LOG family protein [Myxosarcina sp. GI1]|uniref:SLOG cluster 4 domain-containing protein n=1 Tax=Myxosarcina sp. GI1 TaxID=1541065 RepID=UPI000564AB12|nr:LOG family protein [Myxosarcina sp. GI1]
MPKLIIGVMGAGEKATALDIKNAYELGKLIADRGWVLLTGGRKAGVMDAASKGAKASDGLTIGILPGKDTTDISEAVDLAIITDLGNARNNINVLTAKVVIACGMGAGTASEVALAIKNGKKVILLTEDISSKEFFTNLSPENVLIANNARDAIALVRQIVAQSN